MYYQVSPGRKMPHLYVPMRQDRSMIIPVKPQPPADTNLHQFCVEMDLGWACVHDLFFERNEAKQAPKYSIRSPQTTSGIKSILSRIIIPGAGDHEENDDCDVQGVTVDFVPLRWYKDNNGCDVTILSSLWFNNQPAVDKIIMAPLGQEGVVFVDMAYTVTKHGLKLTLVVELEVDKENAIKDIIDSFLKIPLPDTLEENDGLQELKNDGPISGTSAVLSQEQGDTEEVSEDGQQIMGDLPNSVDEQADPPSCAVQTHSQVCMPDVDRAGEVPTLITPGPPNGQPEIPELATIMQILNDHKQIRDDYEREFAELKQRLQVLSDDATQLYPEQADGMLEAASEDEKEPDILEGTQSREEPRGQRVDLLPTYTPPIQDTTPHNYKELQALEVEKYRAYRAALQDANGSSQETTSGVWKGRPPSSTEPETPSVTVAMHFMKTRSAFNIHLVHCIICKKTARAMLHGTRCQEDGCAWCQKIAGDLAHHIIGCTSGTQCPIPVCASGVPLRLYGDGTTAETAMFVGLVRLCLRRLFSCD